MSTPKNSPFDIDDKLWQISEAFIDHYGLTTLHTASFDYAVEELIPAIIEEKGNISLIRDGIKHTVKISNVCLTPPIHKDDNGVTFRPTPKMCVDSSLSYAAGVYVDITYIGPDDQINVYNKKYIGDIFIPVGCNLCTLKSIKNDHKRMAELKEDINSVGGYFIVKGAYKVIVPQVKCAHNKIHLYVGKNTSVSGKPKFSKYAEVKCGGLISHQTTVQVGLCRKYQLMSVTIPYIDVSIPIGIIFKALGLKSDKEIASYIFESEWFKTAPSPKHKEAILLLVASLERSYFCKNTEDALYYIGSKGKKFNDKLKLPKAKTDAELERAQIIDYARYILRVEFLSHIEPGESHFIDKCIYLGRMTRKLLLCHVELIPISDRDHAENKRVHTTGMIIAAHFYKAFCQLTGKIVGCIDADIKKKKHINVCSYITQPYIITTSFLSAFLTNKWNNGAIIGISQPLDNFNYCATLSFLRKFVITLAKDGGKIELPRFLHGAQWGGSCMYETPEGKRVGLVQILPLCSIITVGCDANPVIELLQDMNIIHINDVNSSNTNIIFDATLILVNGAPQGYTYAPQEIVGTLRLMRRTCQLNPTIAISYDRIDKEIRILTDAGRHVRGVITVENGELVIPESILNDMISKKFNENGKTTMWSYLMEKGYVGLIDKDEDNCIDVNIDVMPSCLAEKPQHEKIQYSYCEMTPDMLEGIGANTSPKNDCNQAPRNIYQAAMTKQAIGIPGLNHMHNKKGKWHALVYPQKPIVNTRIAKKVGLERVPMGQNATVVVMPWKGMNQEDSLILNEEATHRGFMCSYVYITHEAVISHPNIPGATKFEKFEIPDNETCNDVRGNMSKLVQNGQWCHVPKNQIVNKNDVIIGMTVTYESPERQTNFQLYSNKKTKANISIIYDQKLPAIIYSVFCGKNGDGYMCIKIVTRQFRRPMLGDKFCLTPDHEVLTTGGWKNVADITTLDTVATLSPKQNLEYQQVSELFEYECKDEDVYHIKNSQIDLTTTLNHKMYVQMRKNKDFELVEAKDIFGKQINYKKNATNVYPHQEYFIFPVTNDKLRMNSFLVLLGIFLAEGWTEIYARKDKNRNNYSVTLSVNKLRVKNALLTALTELHYHYTETKDEKWKIYNKNLALYLKDYSPGATHKFIPEWCFLLCQDQSIILLNAMLCGDGTTTNSGTSIYYTSSTKLKDDVQRLALHCGWSANVTVRSKADTSYNIEGRTGITTTDSFAVNIIKKRNTPQVNHHHVKTQNVQVEEIVKYTGKVYCFDVPNHVFYVRRNGKTVWTGNSARHGQKGTAGAICPSKEMPFLVKRGYTPNILINPLAFPSRMTIGLFVEAILGRALTSSALECPEYNLPLCLDAEEGTEGVHTKDVDVSELKYSNNFNPDTDYNYNLDGDASPFRRNFGIEHIRYIIKCIDNMGINGFGEEEVMDPTTGQKMTALVFSGIVYYQRLKHMAVDKIHSRSTGSMHGLHRQPVEGRAKGGGFRIGHMERDFLSIHTPIALKEGISVMMGSLKNFEIVWGYDSQKELLVKSNQVDFGNCKQKFVYEVTLEDGRVIKAGKHHPFLTEKDGLYAEVHELIVGEDRLGCSLSTPLVDLQEEFVVCKDWIWNKEFWVGINPDFKICTKYEFFRKSLALARLIGLTITDGHATKNGKDIFVFLGHDLDVETILDDLNRITGIKCTCEGTFGHYKIRLPYKLSIALLKMDIIQGAKVSQDAKFPNFISTKTPLPILREFLGGVFGGDGHTLCLSNHRNKMDLLKSVCISWTKNEGCMDSLKLHMESLKEMLLLFGIESTIQAAKETTHSKTNKNVDKHCEIVLNIPLTHVILFSEKIGFRYCEHKSIRLSAGVCYRRFREGVLRQRMWICNRVDELIGYKKQKAENPTKSIQKLSETIKIAQKELEAREPILHKEVLCPPKRVGQLILGQINNEIRSTTFPTVYDFLKNIGALKYFIEEESSSSSEKKVEYGTKESEHGIQVYYLKVIRVKLCDYKLDMCDITVSETESYLANGVVAHNCMLAQGTPEMVRDRLFFQSDAYTMPVCQVCGMTAIDDGKTAYCRLCQTSKIVNVQLPFGTKLMAQEFSVLNHVARILTLPEPK